jgi:ribonuclease HI
LKRGAKAEGAVTLFTDGAARGNPGPAGIGVVALRGDVELFNISRYIGHATNNMAEYLAVIEGLEKAAGLDVSEVTVMMDSELVERQLTGVYRVKDGKLKVLHARAVKAAAAFERCYFVHVPREKNAAADGLANEALDSALNKRKGGGRTRG